MDVLKLALIAGGGYLVYRYLFEGTTASTTATTATAATTTTAATPATTAPVAATPVSGPAIEAAVQTAANNAGYAGQLLTCDQWNYFYAQVRGVSAFDCGSPNVNRSEKMSLDEFWALGASLGAGMSGLGRYAVRSRVRAGMGNYVTATGVRF